MISMHVQDCARSLTGNFRRKQPRKVSRNKVRRESQNCARERIAKAFKDWNQIAARFSTLLIWNVLSMFERFWEHVGLHGLGSFFFLDLSHVVWQRTVHARPENNYWRWNMMKWREHVVTRRMSPPFVSSSGLDKRKRGKKWNNVKQSET